MKQSIISIGLKPVGLLFLFLLTSFYACKKKSHTEEAINNSKFIAEKTTVKTFEVIQLSSKAIFQDKYNARFGSASVPVVKLTDSTLGFIVPDVNSGEYILRFDSAAIKFNVVKTQQTNPDQLVSTAFKNFDTYLSNVPSITARDTVHIESMKQNKAKVINMYNSLTAEQKRLTVLFYEANEALFKTFEDKVPNVLNADIRLRPIQISECAKTNYKEYGTCIAEVLNPLLYVLIDGLDKALITIENDGVYNDYEVPFLSALYLRFFEKEKIFAFRRDVESFLYLNWILDDRMFDNITTVYPDEEFVDMNINAGFRPLNPAKDAYISSEMSHFFNQMASLKSRWVLLPFLGYFPEYQSTLVPVTLTTSEISISQISNSNVKIGDRDGETIKFNTTSTSNEYFSYRITTEKQGFFETKEVIGAKVGPPKVKVTISNASNYPFTQILNQTTCGGYVICDFTCAESSWNDALQMPQITDAFGNSKPVNGVLLDGITNNWGFQYSSCTSSGDNAVIYYNVIKSNGVVTGKVKVFGDAGTCSPPYSDQFFTSFRFSLISSTLPGLMKTSYFGTYDLVSNQLFTYQ